MPSKHTTPARQVLHNYLSEAEQAKLFRHISQFAAWDARRDLAMFTLLRHSGMRVGSAVRFTVADAQRAIAEQYLTIRPEIAKAGRGYGLHANTACVKALRQLLKLRTQIGALHDLDAPLIVGRDSRSWTKGLTTRQVQRRIKHWCQQAGVHVISPHGFRHTLARRIMDHSTANHPLRVAASALGQSDLRSTMRYTTPTREQVAADLQGVAKC